MPAEGEQAAEPVPGDEARGFVYDAFISYASGPDGRLVRAVEAFLEGLHAHPLLEQAHRRRLEICVDGSDFRKPRRSVESLREEDDPVFSLVTQYMARAKALVVFAGPTSREHRWLNAELRWWLKHRGTHDVHVVLSHGATADPAAWMPVEAQKAGFGATVWFDFRNARQAMAGSASNRDYAEERLRLAAALVGDELAAGDLVKGWRVALERERRRQRYGVTGAIIALAALGVGLADAIRESRDRAEEAKVGVWTTLANAGGSLDPDRRLEALIYGAAALSVRPTADAFRGLAESLQVLSEPVTSVQVDSNGQAVDAVAYLGQDRWLATAGIDNTLRLVRRHDLAVVAHLPLRGRTVSITDLAEQQTLVISGRSGVEMVRYRLGDVPALETVGRATVAPLRAGESSYSGQMLAATVDRQRGVLYASATTGRIEWYMLAEASGSGWKPRHSVELLDSRELPLGIFGMAYVRQHRRLVIASVEGEIHCLDAANGQRSHPVLRHSADIFAMAVHDESGQVIAVDARGGWLRVDASACSARVVDPPVPFGSIAPSPLGILMGGPQVDPALTNAAFSPDGTIVSLTGHDGTARLLSSATAGVISIAPHTSMTRSSAVSRDGSEVVVSTADGRLTFWRVFAGAERRRVAGMEEFAIDMEGRSALLVGQGMATELDLASMALGSPVEHSVFKGLVNTVAGKTPGQYAVWRAESGTWGLVIADVQGSVKKLSVREVAVPPEQRARIAAIAPFSGKVWAVAAQGDVDSISLVGPEGELVERWILHQDPRRLAVVDGLLVFTDAAGRVSTTESGGPVLEHFGFDSAEVSLAAASRHFLAVGRRGTASHALLCEVAVSHSPPRRNGQPVACATIPFNGTALRAAVSPDGDAVAIAVKGDDVRPDAGHVIVAMRRTGWRNEIVSGTGRADALVFSPDSLRLVIGERRGLTVWDLPRRAAVTSLPTPSPVQRLATRERPGEGPLLVSVDGLHPPILRVWDASTDAFIRLACLRWPEHRALQPRPGVFDVPPRETICSRRRP